MGWDLGKGWVGERRARGCSRRSWLLLFLLKYSDYSAQIVGMSWSASLKITPVLELWSLLIAKVVTSIRTAAWADDRNTAMLRRNESRDCRAGNDDLKRLYELSAFDSSDSYGDWVPAHPPPGKC